MSGPGGSGGGGGGGPASEREPPPRWAEAALHGYQRQISALEMPEWEQTVERRRARGYGGAPRKSAKPATGLIDLDLVRGQYRVVRAGEVRGHRDTALVRTRYRWPVRCLYYSR